MGDFIATTARLSIRKIEDGDQDLVYALSQESSLLSNFPTDDEYVDFYRKVCWDETNSPNTYNGMIFIKDSGEFVGKVCMQYIDRELPELGIDIAKMFQNQGYGPEAIVAFCNWYSATYGLNTVKVRISEENSHSMHIFEKLGAEYNKATSYLSEDLLNALRKELPDTDLSVLSQNSVRDYLLHIPLADCERDNKIS